MEEITIQKNPHPKPKPDQSALGFGQIFTDHMFIMDYDRGPRLASVRASYPMVPWRLILR